MKRSIGAKTLIYPTPTWIVGSYDKQGKPNGMTAAWGGICCSDPPCVAVSLRKATYSYGSLIERKAFTVSVPSQGQVKEADYFGLVSGRETDKFAATGLTPVRSDLVDAPYVQECPLVLECKVLHVHRPGPAHAVRRPDPRREGRRRGAGRRRDAGHPEDPADHLLARQPRVLRRRGLRWATPSPWARKSDRRSIPLRPGRANDGRIGVARLVLVDAQKAVAVGVEGFVAPRFSK